MTIKEAVQELDGCFSKKEMEEILKKFELGVRAKIALLVKQTDPELALQIVNDADMKNEEEVEVETKEDVPGDDAEEDDDESEDSSEDDYDDESSDY